MSIAPDILRTYRAPRAVLAARTSGPVREDRALAALMAACGLIFVAQWPRLAREAWADPSVAFDARLGGALFAWLLIMPLALYVLTSALGLVISALGARRSGFEVRMTVFWSLLASTPLWLLAGLVGGFIGTGGVFTAVSTLALAVFVVFAALGLSAPRAAEAGA